MLREHEIQDEESNSSSCCTAAVCGELREVAAAARWSADNAVNIGLPLNMAQTAFTMIPAFAAQAFCRIFGMDSSTIGVLNLMLGNYMMGTFLSAQGFMAARNVYAMVEKMREVIDADDITKFTYRAMRDSTDELEAKEFGFYEGENDSLFCKVAGKEQPIEIPRDSEIYRIMLPKIRGWVWEGAFTIEEKTILVGEQTLIDYIHIDKSSKFAAIIKEEIPLLLTVGYNILSSIGALAVLKTDAAFVVGGVTLSAPMLLTVALTLATLAAGYNAYMAAPGSDERAKHIVNALWSGALTAMYPAIGLGGIHDFGLPHFMSPLGENIVQAITLTGSFVPAVVGASQSVPQRVKDIATDVVKSSAVSVAGGLKTIASNLCSAGIFNRCVDRGSRELHNLMRSPSIQEEQRDGAPVALEMVP